MSKIIITTEGDLSVGIRGEHVTIDWPGMDELLCDYGARPAALKLLEGAIESIAGEKATAEWLRGEDDVDDPGFGRPR